MRMTFKIGRSFVFQQREEQGPSRAGQRAVSVKRSRKARDRRPIRKRLEEGARILQTIDQRRLAEGHPLLGSAIERAIIDRELEELSQNLRVRTPRWWSRVQSRVRFRGMRLSLKTLLAA